MGNDAEAPEIGVEQAGGNLFQGVADRGNGDEVDVGKTLGLDK
jgi:hypothetical protein